MLVIAVMLGGVVGAAAGCWGEQMAARVHPAAGGRLAAGWRVTVGVTCLAVAAVFAGMTVSLPVWLLPVFAVLTAVAAVLFIVDLRTLRLPDRVVLPLYPAVAVLLAVAGWWSGQWPVGRAVVSAGLWAVTFGLPWLLTAGRGIGFGDVKLGPVFGLALGWLGWGASVVGLVAGVAVGAAAGLVLLVAGRAGPRSALPYGPAMITGVGVGLFAGQGLWDVYWGALGLG